MVVLQVLALAGYGGFLTATFGWRTLQTKRTSVDTSRRALLDAPRAGRQENLETSTRRFSDPDGARSRAPAVT